MGGFITDSLHSKHVHLSDILVCYMKLCSMTKPQANMDGQHECRSIGPRFE